MTGVHELRTTQVVSAAPETIRVSVVGGLTVEADDLTHAISSSAASIERVEARFMAFAPVTAEVNGALVPAAGEIVGVDMRSEHQIDRWRSNDDRAGTDSLDLGQV